MRRQSFADILNRIGKPGQDFMICLIGPQKLVLKKKKRVMGDFYFMMGLPALVLFAILIEVLVFEGKKGAKLLCKLP